MKEEKLFCKDFTLVVIGQIISLFGNGILRFALPLYLLRETQSATLFGIVTACSFLPMIILSFLGGILADRKNKRDIMVALDFITAFIVLTLFLVLGKMPIVPLFIVALMMLYGISGTYQPTVQASIPVLVSEKNIMPASAIINQIGALAGLLGPIVGGMLFGTFGIKPILVISMICFVFSAIMELFIKIPYIKRNDNIGSFKMIKNDLHESIHYIKCEKPSLIQIITLIAVFNLVLSAMMMVGIPILIVDILNMSDRLLGVSQGMLALGGLCGGIATSVFWKKLKLENSHRILLLCGVCIGVMAILLQLQMTPMINYVVITIVSFCIMALATIFSIQMMATVQIETPPELVGKVIALMMSLSMCAQPIGQAIYGIIFDQFRTDLGIVLLIVALLSVVIAMSSKRVFQNNHKMGDV